MTTTSIKKELAKRLKKAGSSLAQFEAAVRRQGKTIRWDGMTYNQIIDYSFCWRKSKEGQIFWQEVAAKVEPRYATLAQLGEAVPDYSVQVGDGIIKVGCQYITKKQQMKLFKILAKQLGYKIEG
jgi:hypothetical protein